MRKLGWKQLTHLSTLPPDLGVNYQKLILDIAWSDVSTRTESAVDKWVNRAAAITAKKQQVQKTKKPSVAMPAIMPAAMPAGSTPVVTR